MPTFHLDKNKIELQIDIDYQYILEGIKCKSTLVFTLVDGEYLYQFVIPVGKQHNK